MEFNGGVRGCRCPHGWTSREEKIWPGGEEARRREDKDVEEEDAGVVWVGGEFIDIERVNVSR